MELFVSGRETGEELENSVFDVQALVARDLKCPGTFGKRNEMLANVH